MQIHRGMERELALEFVRVTEAAALAAARHVGRGEKNKVDGEAVDAMRRALETIQVDGVVVIGEGEMDEAPMLYTGERVGMGVPPEVDIAVDPVEGTNIVAKGLTGAVAVLAVADRGCLLHAPDMYMDKIAVGPRAAGKINIDASPEENLEAIACSLNKDISEVTVVILDRARHYELIRRVRRAGARIRLITDGDVSPAVATAFDESGVDVVMGIGGAPEGVLAAAALRCLGGEMQGRLWPEDDDDVRRALAMGITDCKRLLTMDDLVQGDNIIFAATGITDGELLRGVYYSGRTAHTHSIVLRGLTGTIRRIEAIHDLGKKPDYIQQRRTCRRAGSDSD